MEQSERKLHINDEEGLIYYKSLCTSLQIQLSEANADIEDFTDSSKELQEELEQELSRMEKGEREMRKSLEEARTEINHWKSKYSATLKDHTNTMIHMQKELESLRASDKLSRVKLRDMELDNDDLEKSEREKQSSLQDLETRFGKSIERIALLEEELVNKARLEEEVQRFKDELRDAEEEMSILRTQGTLLQRQPTSDYSNNIHENVFPSTIDIDDSPSRTPSSYTPEKNVHPSSFFLTTLSSSLSSSFGIEPVNESALELELKKLSSMSIHPNALINPSIDQPQPPLLARSTKTLNLSSTARSESSTPKAVRERRADGMIKDMKEMTDRVKQLTSRLDSRRSIVMAGSSIPRAGQSPRLLSKSVKRTSCDNASKIVNSNTEHIGSFSSSETLERNRILSTQDSITTTLMSTRPSSRSSIRTLTRPPSRLSSLLAPNSHNYNRSTTPTNDHLITSSHNSSIPSADILNSSRGGKIVQNTSNNWKPQTTIRSRTISATFNPRTESEVSTKEFHSSTGRPSFSSTLNSVSRLEKKSSPTTSSTDAPDRNNYKPNDLLVNRRASTGLNVNRKGNSTIRKSYIDNGNV